MSRARCRLEVHGTACAAVTSRSHVGRPGRWLALIALVGCAACAAPKPRRVAPTADQLAERASVRAVEIEAQHERLVERTLARIRAEHLACGTNGHAEPPVFDVLMLSGGGQYGAFGAGVLRGWASSEDLDCALPQFDLVTGVSTGSLIAPFVYAGREQELQRVERFYREAREDIAVLRGLLFFLPGRDSFFDVSGLEQTLEDKIGPAELQMLRDEHAKHRTLLVATTDLELGTVQVWDLGYEATRLTDDELALVRVRAMLQASSSIPAVFPPVELDGGMHVDGGVAGSVFLPADVLQTLHARLAAEPELAGARVRVWTILNGKVSAGALPTASKWPAIARRSYQVAKRFAVAAELRRVDLLCRWLDAVGPLQVEFRYIAIPEDFDVPLLEMKTKIFDKQLMGELVDLGERLGRDPASWQTEAPVPESMTPGS